MVAPINNQGLNKPLETTLSNQSVNTTTPLSLWGNGFSTGGINPFGFCPAIEGFDFLDYSPNCFSNYNFTNNFDWILKGFEKSSMMNFSTQAPAGPVNNPQDTEVNDQSLSGNFDNSDSAGSNNQDSSVEAEPTVSEIPGTTYHKGEQIFRQGADRGRLSNMLSKIYTDEKGNRIVEVYNDKNLKINTTTIYSDGSFDSKHASEIKGTPYHAGETVRVNNQGFLVKEFNERGLKRNIFYKNGKLVKIEYKNSAGLLLASSENGITTIYKRNGEGKVTKKINVKNPKISYLYYAKDKKLDEQNYKYTDIRFTDANGKKYKIAL